MAKWRILHMKWKKKMNGMISDKRALSGPSIEHRVTLVNCTTNFKLFLCQSRNYHEMWNTRESLEKLEKKLKNAIRNYKSKNGRQNAKAHVPASLHAPHFTHSLNNDRCQNLQRGKECKKRTHRSLEKRKCLFTRWKSGKATVKRFDFRDNSSFIARPSSISWCGSRWRAMRALPRRT